MMRPAGPGDNGQRRLVGEILQRAVQLAAADRVDDALRELNGHGKVALATGPGRNVLGIIYLRQSRQKEALRAFDDAIRRNPSFAEAHCNRGVALQALGRPAEALRAYEQALSLRSAYPLAAFNRANVLAELNRFADALNAYQSALLHDPRLAEAYLARASLLMRLRRYGEALTDIDQALQLRPIYPEGRLLRMKALMQACKFEEAIAAADAVLGLDPANNEALFHRAMSLQSLERDDESIAALERLAALSATTAAASGHRAAALIKLGRTEEALAEADRAVSLEPRNATAHLVRAEALHAFGRGEERLEALGTALTLEPQNAAARVDLASALDGLGETDAAMTAYRSALAAAGEDAHSRYEIARYFLSMGLFEEGWRKYEVRLQIPGRKVDWDPDAPIWRGEPIAGKRLLLNSEQGMGDSILAVRYLSMLKAKGALLTYVVRGALLRLFEPLLDGIDTSDLRGLRHSYDYQVGLMSLPGLFGTRLDAIPANIPYLSAAPGLIEKWRQRIGPDGFRIGIVWQGNPRYERDRTRSIPLACYAELSAIPGVRLISLQAVHGLDQLEQLPPDIKVETLGPDIVGKDNGFAETAAAMANLDLIVTSDTAMCHLAGALGRPTFVGLDTNPDWRWLRGRTDSPWYPMMRLFRQATPGDWHGVFTAIAADVASFIKRDGRELR